MSGSGGLEVKGNFYTLGYAAGLGAVCALLLTAAADFTAPYKAANAKAEEVLNILTALRVPLQSDVSSERLVEIFNVNVRGGETVYVYSPPQAKGEPEAVAIRFSGPGLWGPIKGFLALESDRKTIRGITFYEQEETPGLGGEIVSSWFRNQFAGKSIVDESGKAGIIIRRGGGKAARNEVDAITGATMTCDKVEAMLNAVIKTIVEDIDRNGE
jgi:Na+-transporting NADH:ubiquinone oxidoreductase subunit C